MVLLDSLFLETSLCPACYGTDMCSEFAKEKFQLTGWSKYSFWSWLNTKYVYFAYYKQSKVVLKKLAHNSELTEVDTYICSEAGLDKACKVQQAIHHLASTYSLKVKQTSFHNNIEQGGSRLGSLLHCASPRLLRNIANVTRRAALCQEPSACEQPLLFYMLLVNTEPVLQQLFPQAENWPFAQHLGACGRVVVQSHEGRPLADYTGEPWHVQLGLALQLLQLSRRLTNAPGGWALYWTDVSWDNVYVTSGGRVRVVDAEHVMVVDKRHIIAEKPQSWSFPHAVEEADCHGRSQCLSYSSDKLCSRLYVDFNYYAFCKTFVSTYAEHGGLLLALPRALEAKHQLNKLTHRCVDPMMDQSREDMVLELIDVLSSILRQATPTS